MDQGCDFQQIAAAGFGIATASGAWRSVDSPGLPDDLLPDGYCRMQNDTASRAGGRWRGPATPTPSPKYIDRGQEHTHKEKLRSNLEASETTLNLFTVRKHQEGEAP